MDSFPSNLVDNLTKGEMIGLLEIMHYSSEAQTQKDFEQILRLVHKHFSFPFVLGGVILAKDVDAKNLEGWDSTVTQHWLLNESYPVAWLQEYFEKDYYQTDPVMETVLTGSGFTNTWAELRALHPLQQLVFDRAATFDMRYGVSASRVDSESQWVSFISCAGLIEGEDVRLKSVIAYILQLLHESLVVWSRLLCSGGAEKFSPRDLELIRWLSAGKSNWEVGRLIGMTERTVKYHVSRLCLQLGVSNRTQLVSEAVSLGLVFPT